MKKSGVIILLVCLITVGIFILKIQLYKDDNERPARLKTLAGNVLIRANNLEEKNHYRKGEESFKRNRDRFIFNYWWQSLQAGSLISC